ncbi:hypothetical protein [Desulfoluna butyratoxydans]|uniref:Uncharacterized protein n=1 Tax=Desulfoluna butyratoxydans TaxID=231438 RepID=A0A4U8YNP9_9BACT|nr:hypothetical protein [Desulfoluna butyratoxydans]VFQ45077.1 hypothetical protein MSL71_27340 [Desulfoluna butyratoxydans]
MLKRSLRSCVVVIAVTLWPLGTMAFTPMSADALKAATGRALTPSAENSADTLLQAYYDLFDTWDYSLSATTYGEDEAFANGEETGELGVMGWAYRMLSPAPDGSPSLFDRMGTFNASTSTHRIPLVTMDIPRLVIIAPRTSYTVMFRSDDEDDDKDFLTVTRDTSLMALQTGTMEVAAR